MKDTVSASEIVGLLIESIEEKNQWIGETLERLNKQCAEEKRILYLQLEEKERSFKQACEQSDRNYEAKEMLEEELTVWQEKYNKLKNEKQETAKEPTRL